MSKQRIVIQRLSKAIKIKTYADLTTAQAAGLSAPDIVYATAEDKYYTVQGNGSLMEITTSTP